MAKNKTEKAMERLVEAIDFFGWTVAIPNSKDDNVVGMVIGQQDYVDGIMGSLRKTKWKYKSSTKAKKAGG